MPLMVKIILLALAFSSTLLSLLAGDKTQYFVHLNFNSTLQLINGISNNLQKLLKYLHGTAVVAFFKIPLISFQYLH